MSNHASYSSIIGLSGCGFAMCNLLSSAKGRCHRAKVEPS